MKPKFAESLPSVQKDIARWILVDGEGKRKSGNVLLFSDVIYPAVLAVHLIFGKL